MVFVLNVYSGRTRQPAPLYWLSLDTHACFIPVSVAERNRDKTQCLIYSSVMCTYSSMYGKARYTHMHIYTRKEGRKGGREGERVGGEEAEDEGGRVGGEEGEDE